jgi:hypothetical protein
MKYRKKPVVIEAVQLTTDNVGEIHDFAGRKAHRIYNNGITEYAIIDTIEGQMKASINDFIIKGVNGEFYPYKPDVFEKTYEPLK